MCENWGDKTALLRPTLPLLTHRATRRRMLPAASERASGWKGARAVIRVTVNSVKYIVAFAMFRRASRLLECDRLPGVSGEQPNFDRHTRPSASDDHEQSALNFQR